MYSTGREHVPACPQSRKQEAPAEPAPAPAKPAAPKTWGTPVTVPDAKAKPATRIEFPTLGQEAVVEPEPWNSGFAGGVKGQVSRPTVPDDCVLIVPVKKWIMAIA